MRSKIKSIMFGVVAAALSGLTASACILHVRVACPNDLPAAGVEVCAEQGGEVFCAVTDDLGIATFELPGIGNYSVCVTQSTLPAGATLSPLCKNIKIESDAPPVVDIVIGGDFCSEPPPPGDCWLTGGGTIGKSKGQGQPPISFGGVVYPGCSPKAAEGGNWNVIDHARGLHFQGQQIIVDGCSGVSTQSPKVNVNIIDFHGFGVIGGIGGNPEDRVAVTFVGRGVDRAESGAGNDLLFLSVSDGSGVVLQIGASAVDPAVLTTGNLQIHTTSCGN
jgi:hypothetical protein